MTGHGPSDDDRPATDLADDRPAPDQGQAQAPGPAPAPADKRPWLERIGLAAIAMVMGALLMVMAVAAWIGGEGILAAMSISGAILTIGVALLTLVRG